MRFSWIAAWAVRSAVELDDGCGILASAYRRLPDRLMRLPASLRLRVLASALVVALALTPAPAVLAAQAKAADPLPEFGVVPPPKPPAEPLPAPAPLPDLGDAAQASLSPAQERKLGETIVQQLRASGGYMNDPEVNDYLNELGHRITSASKDIKQDFEFFAVPDPAINAFALPGGYIGVHSGLILLTQNESELAAVLAHEISHVTQHHVARMIAAQKDTMLMTLAGLALAVLAARSGGSSNMELASGAMAASQALLVQNQLNFTRENEYEADRIGFQRLDAAGFDVAAMGSFMKRMQKAVRFSEGNAPSYLRTHPLTYERIAEAEARAQDHKYRQVVDSLDFHMVRALLRSYEGDAKDAVAYFDESLSQRKYNNLVATQYGLVASLLRAKSLARAKTEVAKLEGMGTQHPMIESIAAHVLLDSGDTAAAIKRFEAALVRYPGKLQLVYDYPDALITAGRFADAVSFTEKQMQRFPSDGPLHLLAARAYAGLDKQLMQHRHQAEYYAWQGNLKGAVDQLELAAKAKDGDFYQASVVDARLRALRREVVDQQKTGFGKSG
jgi:predicted Zn-dependent protease